MPFIVETGAGLADSTSYVSEDEADIYFEDRAKTTWTDSTDDKEAALIRATAALDGIYRQRYPGMRAHGRDQALEWPRQDATDAEGVEIGEDEIPIEIIEATCELAVRELVSPGSVLPDLDRGGAVRRIQAGSVAIEYGDSASVVSTLQTVDGILAPLIGGSARSSGIVGIAARG